MERLKIAVLLPTCGYKGKAFHMTQLILAKLKAGSNVTVIQLNRYPWGKTDGNQDTGFACVRFDEAT